jgi:hypothetical protein
MKDYAWNDMEEPLNRILKPSGITFEEFRKIGIFVGNKLYRHYEKKGFDTPSKKLNYIQNNLRIGGSIRYRSIMNPPKRPIVNQKCQKSTLLSLLAGKRQCIDIHSGDKFLL